LSERDAEAARKRLRRRFQKKSIQLNGETLEAAGYIVLFTTTTSERLSAARCIELYRLRWQVELQIKRWKSICGFDRMPNFRPDTIVSWLYAKLLAAVLLEKLASLHSGVFPPIDWKNERNQKPSGARASAMEADPDTVAVARVRAPADSALRSAAQSCGHH
jgi:hypothetical protein